MLKHVGKVSATQEKVVVIFREIPEDTNNCLVVLSKELGDNDHDELMASVESADGQQSDHLGTVISTRMNRAGRPLLESLHRGGKLKKFLTTEIMLTPRTNSEVLLSEVNDILRGQQRGKGEVDFTGNADLANSSSQPARVQSIQQPSAAQATDNNLLSDADLAKSLVNQATLLKEEADKLMADAAEYDPSLSKPTAKKATKKAPAKKKTSTVASDVNG
jgi:hypothetical protein